MSDIEHDAATRLSQSALWRWSAEFYREAGQAAWTAGAVPWRVTNSVRMAKLYAHVIDAWADELGASAVRVVEVGAGSGRLAFHLVRELRRAGRLSRYLITDAMARNVEAWRAQPQLKALEREGLVQCLQWDGKGALPASSVPTVAIANYVFDTLPHDAWRVHDGVVFEGHVTATNRDGELSWDVSYGEPQSEVPAFVRGYAAAVDEGLFTVPVGAFALLTRLSQSAGLVLAADKGLRTRDEVRASEGLALARHGSLSAMVNFDALRAWCGWRGLFEPEGPSDELKVVAVPLSPRGGQLPQTRAALTEAFAEHSPVQAVRGIDAAVEGEPSFGGVMRALLDSGFDSDALVRLAEPLRQLAPGLDAQQGALLVSALEQVAAQHFDFHDPFDVDFELGTVLQRLGQLSLAVDAYQRSQVRRGAHATTAFNLAMCQLDLGQLEAGAKSLQQVLQLDPGHQKAAAVLERVSQTFL